MGIISGYPTGAKIVTDFYSNNLCTKEEAERLLTFTNNSGPLFIIGTVGISMFSSSTVGVLLFLCHLLACLSVGILFRFYKRGKRHSNTSTSNLKPPLQLGNLGTILSDSILNSIQTTIIIGGFIVLFSVIISILNQSNVLSFVTFIFDPIFRVLNIPTNIIAPFFTGILELTNGLIVLSKIHLKNITTIYCFCSFLLGFGGISILLQVLSITSKTDLSIKPYICGKILQGLISALYTFIIFTYIPFFNLNL